MAPFTVCHPGERLGAIGHRCNAGGKGSPVESSCPASVVVTLAPSTGGSQAQEITQEKPKRGMQMHFSPL